MRCFWRCGMPRRRFWRIRRSRTLWGAARAKRALRGRAGQGWRRRGRTEHRERVELRSTDSRGRLSPHNLNAKSREGRGKCVIFTSQKQNPTRAFHRFLSIQSAELLVWRGICVGDFLTCTKFGHALVDGLHSIENTPTYRAWFFVDGKNRRSTTRLFFDSFLSFSGWCGVRGSSGVTFLIERLGRRVSEGL